MRYQLANSGFHIIYSGNIPSYFATDPSPRLPIIPACQGALDSYPDPPHRPIGALMERREQGASHPPSPYIGTRSPMTVHGKHHWRVQAASRCFTRGKPRMGTSRDGTRPRRSSGLKRAAARCSSYILILTVTIALDA